MGRIVGLGDAESDATAYLETTSDPALTQLRAISVPMGYLRQQINAELSAVADPDQVVNWNQLGTDLAQMNVYQQQLVAAINAFKTTTAYTSDAATANELNNWLAFAADWAQQVGSTIAQLPTDVANYLAEQLGNFGTAATSAVLPWVLGGLALGGLVLFGVKNAEKSRTYRKYVA